MVLKGQFLERMTTFESAGLQLEGLFHEGRGLPGCVIASPHPVFGGSMDSPVCAELAWAISRKGCPTLRFNYRGVGASHGKGHVTQPNAREELEDLRAAARSLCATTKRSKVLLAGYSFGAWLASYLAADEEKLVERLVLVAPPNATMPFDFDALSRSGVPTMLIVPGTDRYVDQDAISALESLPNLTIERIPEADHFFLRGLAPAGKLAAEHLVTSEHGTLLELPEDEGPPLELDV